jgi:hypothetical protein
MRAQRGSFNHFFEDKTRGKWDKVESIKEEKI